MILYHEPLPPLPNGNAKSQFYQLAYNAPIQQCEQRPTTHGDRDNTLCLFMRHFMILVTGITCLLNLKICFLLTDLTAKTHAQTSRRKCKGCITYHKQHSLQKKTVEIFFKHLNIVIVLKCLKKSLFGFPQVALLMIVNQQSVHFLCGVCLVI